VAARVVHQLEPVDVREQDRKRGLYRRARVELRLELFRQGAGGSKQPVSASVACASFSEPFLIRNRGFEIVAYRSPRRPCDHRLRELGVGARDGGSSPVVRRKEHTELLVLLEKRQRHRGAGGPPVIICSALHRTRSSWYSGSARHVFHQHRGTGGQRPLDLGVADER